MDDNLQTDTCEHGYQQGRFPMFEELLTTSKSMLHGVDTYLTFAENRLSRAAVTRLNPTKNTVSGSITLIHGPSGVGKTHLSRWTLHELYRRHPRIRFAITSVKNLGEMMERGNESQSLAELLEQFRSLDVLVCEDLHSLEQRPTLQPWFVTLIETLEEGLTQVLITSRKPAGKIRSLDQRLVSRCHGGLSVAMPLPSLESRVQLFQHWFQELRLPILKPFIDSARFLAEKLAVSPRDLRQVVLDLVARQSRRPCAIDVAYLERWLATRHRPPQLSFDAIVLQVAQEFGVEASEILSRSRQNGLAVPRQCAMWLARHLTGRSLEQIGKYFDRSHTTVAHSLARLEDVMPGVPSLRQQVQKLRRQLKELPREDCA